MFLDFAIDENCDGNGEGVCINGASCVSSKDNKTKECKCNSGSVPVEIPSKNEPFKTQCAPVVKGI